MEEVEQHTGEISLQLICSSFLRKHKEQKGECFDGMQFWGKFFEKFCVLVGKILTQGF